MDSKEFDVLWEQAKVGKYAENLAAEYPAWRTRTRRMAGSVLGIVLVLVMATPVIMQPRTPSIQEKVYCNNIGISDQHWIDLADDLLMNA